MSPVGTLLTASATTPCTLVSWSVVTGQPPEPHTHKPFCGVCQGPWGECPHCGRFGYKRMSLRTGLGVAASPPPWIMNQNGLNGKKALQQVPAPAETVREGPRRRLGEAQLHSSCHSCQLCACPRAAAVGGPESAPSPRSPGASAPTPAPLVRRWLGPERPGARVSVCCPSHHTGIARDSGTGSLAGTNDFNWESRERVLLALGRAAGAREPRKILELESGVPQGCSRKAVRKRVSGVGTTRHKEQSRGEARAG